jgi:hypothetical protein
VTFGGLMMAAGAFTQAQSSLRWFIDNFSTIADWRATLLRVANFRQRADQQRRTADFESRIDLHRRSSRVPLRIDDLADRLPANADVLKETCGLEAGERALILGLPEPARLNCSAPWRDCGPGARDKSAGRRRTDFLPAARHARTCPAARCVRSWPIP